MQKLTLAKILKKKKKAATSGDTRRGLAGLVLVIRGGHLSSHRWICRLINIVGVLLCWPGGGSGAVAATPRNSSGRGDAMAVV